MIIFRRVVGHSMEPTLREGQLIFAHLIRNFKPGQVVIAQVGTKEVVKRILKIEKDLVYLAGDKAGHDIGFVLDTNVTGIVFWPRK